MGVWEGWSVGVLKCVNVGGLECRSVRVFLSIERIYDGPL